MSPRSRPPSTTPTSARCNAPSPPASPAPPGRRAGSRTTAGSSLSPPRCSSSCGSAAARPCAGARSSSPALSSPPRSRPLGRPAPPAWPDLQIADAVTRLSGRATRPVTQRIGRDTWSGIARTWEIIPQRAGDYDLGQPQVTLTVADPDARGPTTTTVAFPAIAFAATIPAGAEGIDPVLAATALTVAAALDGLPASPKPGDAFLLTLTTSAAGPPAIFLPPLAPRIAVPPGLRAYPREPVLADGPTATRTEAIAFVIEQPGAYAFPAVALDWWNTAQARRETATTDPISVTVAAPPGWRAPGHAGRPRGALVAVAAGLLGIGAALAVVLRRRRTPRAPTESQLYRALRRAVRAAPPQEIRRRLAPWLAALPSPSAPPPAVLAALRALDRRAYGPPGDQPPEDPPRQAILASLATMRAADRPDRRAPLPPLNPTRAEDPVRAAR